MKTCSYGKYIGVYVPEHPYANNRGYILEHRYVVEQMLGRVLEPHEQVHHKNENKRDNRLENLELMLIGDHTAYHKLKVDETAIASLMFQGLGCKRIAKALSLPVSTVKYALKRIRHRGVEMGFDRELKLANCEQRLVGWPL